jgi:insulysin
MKIFLLLIYVFLIGSCAWPPVNEQQMVEKHPLDKSQIRKLTLENGLKVYLLSDPDFNKSSAAMCVDVGSLQDPENRQGLAHFLEHMLFLGTEKFPNVDEYSTYLRNNGGMSNAYTAGDHTNYQFQVFPDALEGALDRFSQFFIAPIFTAEYTNREKNAVHSEYQKNKMNDNWREQQIAFSFVRKGHPQRKFNIGNLETLGDIKREELLEFYNNEYSSNRMSLAVLSNHGLNVLEEWSKTYFSAIQNYDLDEIIYEHDVINRKETFRLINIIPVKDLRDLEISFILPGTRKYYKSKPGRILGYMTGHEGRGSILSFLKAKGWATTLRAEIYQATDSYGYANLRIGLTPEGLKEHRNIIKSVVSYIKLLKNSEYPDYVFDHLKTMSFLNETYSNKGEGMWRATSLANETNQYPLEDAGRIRYIFEEQDKTAWNEILSYCVPDNMLSSLISKDVKTNKIEHFFDAPYGYEEDDEFYQELINAGPNSGITIPEPNAFLPQNASVPNRKYKDLVIPRLLVNERGMKLYYGKDHEFLRPKGVINFKILFPKDKMSLEHQVMLKIYVACVNESLNEPAYPAKQAGLNYTLREGYEGLYMTISGYTESAMILYDIIMSHLVNYQISDDEFNALKDKILRDYQNFPLSDAWQITRKKNADIYNNINYDWEESFEMAKDITSESVGKYAESIFKRIYVEGLIYGNFSKREARQAIRIFKEKTSARPVHRKGSFELKYLSQERPESIQYIGKLDVDNSCFWREYHFGMDSPKTRADVMIISQALKQPFFTEMRTNQQLGYIVWSSNLNRDENHYLYFAIQSGEYSADELNHHADKFIKTCPALLNSISDDMFEQLRESSIENLEQKPKSISERSTKLTNLIFEHNAEFDRDEKTISAIKNVEKNKLVETLEKILSEESYRMVNCLMFADDHGNAAGITSTFDDVRDWKKSRIYK